MACVQKYGVANVTKTGVANVSKRGVANVQMAYELPPLSIPMLSKVVRQSW